MGQPLRIGRDGLGGGRGLSPQLDPLLACACRGRQRRALDRAGLHAHQPQGQRVGALARVGRVDADHAGHVLVPLPPADVQHDAARRIGQARAVELAQGGGFGHGRERGVQAVVHHLAAQRVHAAQAQQFVVRALRDADEVARLREAPSDVALVQAPGEARGVARLLAERAAQGQQVVHVQHQRALAQRRHPGAQGLVGQHEQGVGRLAAHLLAQPAREQQVLVHIARPLGQRCAGEAAVPARRGRPQLHVVAQRLVGALQHAGEARHALRGHERRVGDEDDVHGLRLCLPAWWTAWMTRRWRVAARAARRTARR